MSRSSGLGITIAFAAWAGGCASGGSVAPATATVTPTASAGRFVWQDLVTHDAAACQAFYRDLLGWRYESATWNGRPYTVVLAGADRIGGIVQVAEGQAARAAWVSYLAVPDVDHALEQVLAAGGRVLVTARPVNDVGRVVVIADPQGAPLGLVALARTPPAEPSDPPLGGFFWREYLARDGPAALSFYRDLAGYESALSDRGGPVEYHVLRRQRARAGLFQLPESAGDIKPNWLPYLRVADPASLSARAESRGGRVLLAPRADVRNGTLAIVADPTGAAVALQKWPL
jgi:hypothetical protein